MDFGKIFTATKWAALLIIFALLLRIVIVPALHLNLTSPMLDFLLGGVVFLIAFLGGFFWIGFNGARKHGLTYPEVTVGSFASFVLVMAIGLIITGTSIETKSTSDIVSLLYGLGYFFVLLLIAFIGTFIGRRMKK